MAISLCSTNVANTGVIQCDTALGVPKKIIIWNDQVLISSVTGTAAFQSYFEAATKLAKSEAGKAFVFPEILDIADNTEANTTGSLNQGYTAILREGRGSYTFKVSAGQSLVPKLRKFNNQNLRILILDANNNIWGVKSGNYFQGAQATVFTGGLRYADAQSVKEGIVDVSVSFLSASELNDSAAFGSVAQTSGLIGLIDVTVKQNVAPTANVYKIGAYIDTAKAGSTINLHDTYDTELAAAGLWVAKSGPTYSTTLTITSVTDDTVNGGWTITFDSTAYTALTSGTKISLNLAAPSVLDAAGVSGVEGIAYTFTKP